MLYSVDIAVPPNTARASPLDTAVRVAPSIIHRVEVQFPAGCAGLVRVQLLRGDHHLAPDDPDQSLGANDYVIPWPDWIELDQPPHVITVRCWSTDDTYTHTVTVRLASLPREILMPPRAEDGMVRRIYRMMFGSGG